MINLIEVAKKVENILNDSNNPIRIEGERVIFVVATQGYRIDSIYNKAQGKNVIPVFVALEGGENNPIPNLNQQSKNIHIGIYYPIKYKDLFYDLETYIDEKLVGKMINIGTLSGTCLTNVGVSTYGEIQSMNLEQFKGWLGSIYENTFDITSVWMSMSFNLYVSSLASGFMFGNEITFQLDLEYYNFHIAYLKCGIGNSTNETLKRSSADDTTITEEGQTVNLYAWKHETWSSIYYTRNNFSLDTDKIKVLTGQITQLYDDEGILYDTASIYSAIVEKDSPNVLNHEITNLVWTNAGTGASISPIAQQLIDCDSYAKNVANITNYNKSLVVYPQNNSFWNLFLALYNTQQLEIIANTRLFKNYGNGMKFIYNQIALNSNENIALGQPLSFTLTLGDKL